MSKQRWEVVEETEAPEVVGLEGSEEENSPHVLHRSSQGEMPIQRGRTLRVLSRSVLLVGESLGHRRATSSRGPLYPLRVAEKIHTQLFSLHWPLSGTS